MEIHKSIQGQIQRALKNKDEIRLLVLRGLSSAFVNELVAKKRKPTEFLSDDEALLVVGREAKKHKESITQFRAGQRDDLAQKEEAELKILEEFLPEMMSEEEIMKIAQSKKEELKIDDKSKSGILVGAIMRETKGKAEGKTVKNVVDSLFN